MKKRHSYHHSKQHPRRRYRLVVAICFIATLLSVGFIAALLGVERTKQQEAALLRKESTKQTQAIVAKLKAQREKNQSTQAPQPSAPTDDNAQPAIPSVDCRATKSHNNPHAIDILVNKRNCIQPLTFVPADMEIIHGATISAKAAAHFSSMYSAAAAAGLPFIVSSSYRSYDQQITTYDYWVSVNGQAGADTVSARAGYSEHQTGLTVDLATEGCWLDCFTSTPQRAWLLQYAADYGFIQRYPDGASAITGYSPESWHYRYVGAQVAQDMKKRGIATLEQYWGVGGGDYLNGV